MGGLLDSRAVFCSCFSCWIMGKVAILYLFCVNKAPIFNKFVKSRYMACVCVCVCVCVCQTERYICIYDMYTECIPEEDNCNFLMT